MRILGIVALGAALGGCASSSAEIAPAYISPVMYQQYTCQQLALEAQAVTSRAGIVSGAQDQKRSNDGLATAAAVVIFWPAAFFVGGNGQTAAELAQLKGQMVAIEQASTFGWERYVGLTGRVIGMHTFGASAPLKELQKKFGFEPYEIVAAAKEQIGRRAA